MAAIAKSADGDLESIEAIEVHLQEQREALRYILELLADDQHNGDLLEVVLIQFCLQISSVSIPTSPSLTSCPCQSATFCVGNISRGPVYEQASTLQMRHDLEDAIAELENLLRTSSGARAESSNQDGIRVGEKYR